MNLRYRHEDGAKVRIICDNSRIIRRILCISQCLTINVERKIREKINDRSWLCRSPFTPTLPIRDSRGVTFFSGIMQETVQILCNFLHTHLARSQMIKLQTVQILRKPHILNFFVYLGSVVKNIHRHCDSTKIPCEIFRCDQNDRRHLGQLLYWFLFLSWPTSISLFLFTYFHVWRRTYTWMLAYVHADGRVHTHKKTIKQRRSLKSACNKRSKETTYIELAWIEKKQQCKDLHSLPLTCLILCEMEMLKFAQDLHSFLRTCQNLCYPYPRDYTQCFPSAHSISLGGPQKNSNFAWRNNA